MNSIPLFPIFFVCSVMSDSAMSQSVQKSILEPTKFLQQADQDSCSKARENQLDVPLHGSSDYCLMIFDDKSGAANESSAWVRINNVRISLQRIGLTIRKSTRAQSQPRKISSYRSADRSLLVVLDVEDQDDACENVDKCCGMFYEGTLMLSTGRQRTTYPVYYYRGG